MKRYIFDLKLCEFKCKTSAKVGDVISNIVQGIVSLILFCDGDNGFFLIICSYLALSLLNLDTYVVRNHCGRHEILLQSEIVIFNSEANIAIDFE